MEKTKEQIIEEILEFFNDNMEIFNDCVEELDSQIGWLADSRYYSMDELNEIFYDSNPIEIIERAIYGRDDDMYSTDSSGNREYAHFNTGRYYFTFDGYGNLVSTDRKDYSNYLYDNTVMKMLEHKNNIDSIKDDEELSELFDELEKAID